MASTTSDFGSGRNTLATILVLMLIANLYLIFAWTEDVIKARHAKDWPTAQGTVTLSRPGKGCGKGQRELYFPDIRYSYSAEGNSYIGDAVAIGIRDCGTRELVEVVLTPYPTGKSVMVWYNPQDPKESALLAGTVSSNTLSNIYSSSAWTAVLLLAIGWLLYPRRSKSK